MTDTRSGQDARSAADARNERAADAAAGASSAGGARGAGSSRGAADAGASSAAPRSESIVVGRHRALLSRTALVSALTLLSRVAGFARETLTAALFGHASVVSDAFITAWRVPNLFRGLMAEGAIATALQTELTRVDHERGDVAGRAFFRAMWRLVAWLLSLACVLAMTVAWLLPDRMPITDWAWLGAEPAAVREFAVIMLPFVVFVCLAAVLSGALNVRGHFFAPSAAPVLMNAGWVLALLAIGFFCADATGFASEHARQLVMARWIAGYVLVAGVVLVVAQLPALRHCGLTGPVPESERAPARSAARRALVASLPLAFGAGAYQLNTLVGGMLAIALLPSGGSSLLYYVSRLQQLPLSLVAVAATSAVFPLLNALGAAGERERLRALHDTTHFAVAYVAVPAAFGLFAFAEPILAVCFEHGEFGGEGVERAAWALRAASLAVLPAGATGLLVRTYYALGDLRTPVRVAALLVVVNAALGVVLVAGFGQDLEGLAWSATLAAWVNVALLVPGLRTKLGLAGRARGGIGRFARIALAAGVSVALARAAHAALAAPRGSASALALCIFLAGALYAGFSALLAIPEWAELRRRLTRGSS